MAKLFLLDIDDTIADRNSTIVYPAALAFLSRTSADIAFVTNQGGPACHDAGWDFSDKFPSLEDVEERLQTIVRSIPLLSNYAVYVAYAWKVKSTGKIIVPSSDRFIFSASIDEAWRKPNPGMLLQAMKDFRVKPHETLMIGDRPEDKGAAIAAGVAFIWAHEFFGRVK